MSEFFDFRFPHKGLNLDRGFGQPIQGATRQAVNVRSCESATKRLRGGSRAGLIKYIPDQLPGEPQDLNVITHVRDPAPIVFLQANHAVQNLSFPYPTTYDFTLDDDPVTPGSFIALFLAIQEPSLNNITVTGVTDSLGNTYSQALSEIIGTASPGLLERRVEVWYANTETGGSCTITATFSTGVGRIRGLVGEWGGVHFTNPIRNTAFDYLLTDLSESLATTGPILSSAEDAKIGFFSLGWSDAAVAPELVPSDGFIIEYEEDDGLEGDGMMAIVDDEVAAVGGVPVTIRREDDETISWIAAGLTLRNATA